MANLDARKKTPPQKAEVDSIADGCSKPPNGGSTVSRVFHSLILPKLASAARAECGPETKSRSAAGDQGGEVAEFCRLLTHGEFDQALAFIEAALAGGADYDSVLLRLFSGAAHRLGMNWETDACGFSDVTIGMTRLHHVLQHLAINAPLRPMLLETRGRALLAPCPGEQHNFGIMMLDHMFHRAGWDLRTVASPTDGQLVKIAASSRFDVVGLSLSCDEKLPRLEKAVSAIRRASRNQDVIILVGGRVFIEDSSLAAKVGADAAPPSAPAALVAAEILMDARRHSIYEQSVMHG